MSSKWSTAALVCLAGSLIALAAFVSWGVTMGDGPQYTTGEVIGSALSLTVIGLIARRWVDPFTIATALGVGYGIGWGAASFPTDDTGTSGVGYVMVIVGVGVVAAIVLVSLECLASIDSLRGRQGIEWRHRLIDVREVLARPRSTQATLVVGLPLILVAAGFVLPGTADESPLGLTGIAVNSNGHQQIVAYGCGNHPLERIQITRSVSYWKNGNVPTLGPFELKSRQNGLVKLDLQDPGALWSGHEAVHITAHKWFALAEGGDNSTQGTNEVDFASSDFAELKPGNIYVRAEYETRLTSLRQSEFIERARLVCAGSR